MAWGGKNLIATPSKRQKNVIKRRLKYLSQKSKMRGEGGSYS